MLSSRLGCNSDCLEMRCRQWVFSVVLVVGCVRSAPGADYGVDVSLGGVWGVVVGGWVAGLVVVAGLGVIAGVHGRVCFLVGSVVGVSIGGWWVGVGVWVRVARVRACRCRG